MWIDEVQKLISEVTVILEREMVLEDMAIATSKECRSKLRTADQILSLAATTEYCGAPAEQTGNTADAIAALRDLVSACEGVSVQSVVGMPFVVARSVGRAKQVLQQHQ